MEKKAKERLCPLFSAADPGAEEYSKCKGESCSMWSRKHRRCGLRSV